MPNIRYRSLMVGPTEFNVLLKLAKIVFCIANQTPPMKPKNAAGPIIAVTLMASLAYAILRYHIFGPIPWKDFPFFILNKGFSLGAFILLTLNFGLGPLRNLGVKVSEGWLSSRKALGMTGFLLVLIHALMSFLLFNPAVYAAFFESDGTLTLMGGVSMLGGVISFVVLWAYNLSFQTFLREDQAFIRFITSRRFLLTAMLFAAIHLFFMGFKGWMNPTGWHGGLPPISLVGFAFFSLGYVINLLGRK
jgi:DMSO/TMAO reductase YedYZ heme-binding membrane subunit